MSIPSSSPVLGSSSSSWRSVASLRPDLPVRCVQAMDAMLGAFSQQLGPLVELMWTRADFPWPEDAQHKTGTMRGGQKTFVPKDPQAPAVLIDPVAESKAMMDMIMAAVAQHFVNMRAVDATSPHARLFGLGDGQRWSLMEEHELDAQTLAVACTRTVEHSCNVGLFLLGQRLGVLASKPPVTPEDNPFGPRLLAKHVASYLGQWAKNKGIEWTTNHTKHALDVMRLSVLERYPELLDALNQAGQRASILSSLTFVPLINKSKASSHRSMHEVGLPLQQLGAALRQRFASSSSGGMGLGHIAPSLADPMLVDKALAHLTQAGTQALVAAIGAIRPAAWPTPTPPMLGQDLERVRSRDADVGNQEMEDSSQPRDEATPSVLPPPSPPSSAPAPDLTTLPPQVWDSQQVQRAVQEQLRAMLPDQTSIVLGPGEQDALGMMHTLMAHMMAMFPQDSSTGRLLEQFYVPMLRTAVHDKDVVTEPHHPVRQAFERMVDELSPWIDDGERDEQVCAHVEDMVRDELAQFDGTAMSLATIVDHVSSYVNGVEKKAAATEKRHVEGLRGRERLVRSQRAARQIVQELLTPHEGRAVGKLTKAFLEHAWVDVLALAALRQDEQPEQFLATIQVGQQLVAAEHAVAQPETRAALEMSIVKGLAAVGYHAEEAEQIAAHVVDPDRPVEPGFSRTEMTMRFKSNARFGVEADDKPLSSHHQALAQQLRALPIGTWLSFFDTDPPVMLRLAWMSAITGQVIFVNRRGQKQREMTVDTMVDMMARGHVGIHGERPTPRVGGVYQHVVEGLLGADALVKASEPAASATDTREEVV